MEPFKNKFSKASIKTLATEIVAFYPDFDAKKFTKLSVKTLDALELKDRVRQISAALNETLPADYGEALRVLIGSVKKIEGGVSEGFIYWPYLQFIEEYGLDSVDLSLDGMEALTPFFSAEFAIRPYILNDSKKTLKRMLRWAKSPNEHVRRLATEGSRPRLPWGIALPELIADPTRTSKILEILKDDSSEYVRRSVSNHMNDFSKDHAAFVSQTCSEWWSESPEMQKLVKHALRNLLKKGDKEALKILGFGIPKFSDVKIKLDSDQVIFGESLNFDIEIMSEKSQSWMIDYAIHHQKANGKMSPKVFKWSVKKVKKDTILAVSKKHKIKPITTRKYYPGEHALEIFINGKSIGIQSFELIM